MTRRGKSDAVVGQDGKPRCPWAGPSGRPLAHYHDKVWGKKTRAESALFEALTLSVFEVGLSWTVVFNKRDAFYEAFYEFDVDRVSGMKEKDVARLVGNPSIIRNRAKIEATVANARTMRSASPSLAALVAAHSVARKQSPQTVADISSVTPEAEALASRLKSQGYRFVGPTSVYAFMQNVGAVNDHVRGCFRAVDYAPSSK
ncbi:MAG: DNA-3-methyladenine glycosylase I [Acidimicrobiales bacterium]